MWSLGYFLIKREKMAKREGEEEEERGRETERPAIKLIRLLKFNLRNTLQYALSVM